MTLKERYQTEMVPALMERLGSKNIYQIPKLLKVVVNVGIGDGAQNAKLFDLAVAELAAITGQKPLITRAKKSVAGFKIRQGMPIGAKVTLREDRMYDFIAKLTCIALPRIRDFRGLNPNGFDGRGNYNLGLTDQLVFPEINYDKVQRMRGMNVTLVTSATSDMDARVLLEQFGFPFRKAKVEAAPAAQAMAS